MKNVLLLFLLFFSNLSFLSAQVTTVQVDDVEISTSKAKYLGHTDPIHELAEKPATSQEKKAQNRRMKKVPDNFKGRKAGGNAIIKELQHQGLDPLHQKDFSANPRNAGETVVNINGLSGFGSPHDPTGDVSDEYYVQAINITTVGVYDLEGVLVQSFAMNTLWSQLGVNSAGDPIILYDENQERWIVTEFTDPANLLVAISDNKDPLGAYSAYSFSTPNFPDYPKYSITPEALVVTTNEQGAGTLHCYFLDLEALYAGAANVEFIRTAVDGTTNSEGGFIVSTPVDWNGTNLPYDSRPMVIRLNDSSWGDVAQDQIEVYSFNLDFDDPNSLTVDRTSIVTTPFDSYPCSENGPGFACAPQLNGDGLDAIPEVIMHVPHLRNFGTHESMVFNFITDLENGGNRSGIRWVELRRTASSDWALFQEGTFGPDDGLDRYMGTIAMDSKGNIGLAYNVSSANSFAGVRYTGRLANDPLGVMTFDEFNAVDGESVINSFGRFGDYSQMSVSPKGDNTFWFTTEYAGTSDSETRILAFKLTQDSIDLAANSIISPVTSANLSNAELVTATFRNPGINAIEDYEINLLLNSTIIETAMIPGPIESGDVFTYTFTVPVDMSAIADYQIGISVVTQNDENPSNDLFSTIISNLPEVDLSLETTFENEVCLDEVAVNFILTNSGENEITSAVIEVISNGMNVGEFNYTGSIFTGESDLVEYTLADNLIEGMNEASFTITQVNGATDNAATSTTSSISYEIMNAGDYVILNLRTDEFPDETNWTLTNQADGSAVASGDFTEESTDHRIVICLDPDACYSLRVTDSYGDGICCFEGDGNFSIEDNEGNVIINNDGNFGNEVIEEFCPSGACLLSAIVDIENASNPTLEDGSIMISAGNGVGPYQYSIDGGATYQDSPLFENLTSGTYNISVLSADGVCAYTETVEVGFATGIHHINGQSIEVAIMPNPTEGVFQVAIDNLVINDPQIQIEIFDVQGKLIQRRIIGKFNDQYIGTISLYDYPNGSYFMRIYNEEISFLEKVVKTN